MRAELPGGMALQTAVSAREASTLGEPLAEAARGELA
jgi:hypothetical protein